MNSLLWCFIMKGHADLWNRGYWVDIELIFIANLLIKSHQERKIIISSDKLKVCYSKHVIDNWITTTIIFTIIISDKSFVTFEQIFVNWILTFMKPFIIKMKVVFYSYRASSEIHSLHPGWLMRLMNQLMSQLMSQLMNQLMM